MKMRHIGATMTLLIAGASVSTAGVAQASAHLQPQPRPTPAAPRAVDFAGTVALDDCSGSLIRMPNSADSDPAIVMTNGHCLESGMPGAGVVIVDQASSRSFTLLNSDASEAGQLQATQIMYATMTDTDTALYRLNTTYDQIRQQYHISPLELSPDHPSTGVSIAVVSGYWKKIYSCSVDGFVPQLREGDWTWKDSMRYTASCDVVGGTSGSPVEDAATRKVVAINNTGNQNGERCTVNNPCEVDENGNVTVHKGVNYAEETYGIVRCMATGSRLDLSLPGCELPKPNSAHSRQAQ